MVRDVAGCSYNEQPITRVDMDAHPSTRPAPEVESTLLGLVYELLDAHQDTVRLGDERADDGLWQAHESYLRDLQRVSRETLARISPGSGEIS
jgi:hypothetical protein